MKLKEFEKEIAKKYGKKSVWYIPSTFETIRKKFLSIVRKSKDVNEFYARCLADEEMKYSEICSMMVWNDENRWKIIRNEIGENCRKTESDVGALKIGNDSFEMFIKNGRGDGTTRYAVYDEKPRFASYFSGARDFFNVKKETYIYNYDCGNEIDIELQNGRYAAMSYDGIIVIYKFDDIKND